MARGAADVPREAYRNYSTGPWAVIMVAGMDEFHARDGMIRLGQLLKAAGLVETGGEAKLLLADGRVTVNGEVETRRGRQLVPGDVVALGDASVRLT